MTDDTTTKSGFSPRASFHWRDWYLGIGVTPREKHGMWRLIIRFHVGPATVYLRWFDTNKNRLCAECMKPWDQCADLPLCGISGSVYQ